MLITKIITFYYLEKILFKEQMVQAFMQKKCMHPTLLSMVKIFLSLHYNGNSSYLFVNNREIVKFKAADSEIVPYPLCLAGLSKDFDSSSLTGLYGYVYDFSVDYRAIKTSKIHDIRAYLMRKNNII